MRLDEITRGFDAYTGELDKVLASDSTRFYLDTSLLMWLIRIGHEARNDFFAWCASRPRGRVRVPVWAAHELHRHLIRGTVASNCKSVVSDAEKKMFELAVLANERADDLTCQGHGYPDREDFVATFEQTFTRMKKLSKVVSFDSRINAASDEVVNFVNAYVLSTDLTPITEILSRTGEFRYSHLVPPGYLDHKPENKFGDAVIWEEMLADLPRLDGESKPDAVLISRDEKTDWVSSAPAIRLNGATKETKSNKPQGFDVTRPHPLLVHEFAVRSGGNCLYLVHPGVLASVIDFGVRVHDRSPNVARLLAASYRPEFLDKLAVTKLARQRQTIAATVGSAPGMAPAPPPFIYADVKPVMGMSIATEIHAFATSSPPDQNSLVQGWSADLSASMMRPIKFGRLFAGLIEKGYIVLRTAVPAMLENLAINISETDLNYIASALLFSAYFDRFGDVLRVPNKVLAALALTLEDDKRLRPAFDSLARNLEAAEAALPYRPGSGGKKVPYSLDIAEGPDARLLRDIRIGAQSALIEPVRLDSPRLLSKIIGKEPSAGMTGLALRALIAQIYFIPFDCLNDSFDKLKLTWLPAAGLALMDTGSPGGLSAVAESGEDGD